MQFHSTTGTNVALSKGNRFAKRLNPDQRNFATVFSSRPMVDGTLFEVQLRQKDVSSTYGGMTIGLISQDPNSITTLPDFAAKLQSSWIATGGKICADGVETNATMPNLQELNVGDRVGVLRSSTGALHLFINGEDLGAKAEGVPPGCYAAVDLSGNCSAISVLDCHAIMDGCLAIEVFPWRIDNFKQLMKSSEAGFFVSSTRFVHKKAIPGVEWFLKVYPNGYKEANGHVAIELCADKSGKKSSAIAPVGQFSASFGVFGTAGPTRGLTRVSKAVKFVRGAVCIVKRFVSQDSVGRLCRGKKGTVHIAGQIFIEAPLAFPLELSRQIFESGAFSDFKIKVKGEAFEFPVHKAVVGTASSTLMRMLNETKQVEITIEGSTLDAVKAMLQYIYGDPLCFDGLEELSLDVLKLADRCDLSGLKEVCEKSLIAMVSKESVLDMANVAYRSSSGCLMKAVSQFIFDNKEIMSGDEWKKLKDENCKLVNEILEFVIKKTYEALPIN